MIEIDRLTALHDEAKGQTLPHNLNNLLISIPEKKKTMSEELAKAIVSASEKMHQKDPQNLHNAVATIHKAGMYYKILSLDNKNDINGKFLYIEECIGYMRSKGFRLLQGKDSDAVLADINTLYKKGHDASRAIAAFGR